MTGQMRQARLTGVGWVGVLVAFAAVCMAAAAAAASSGASRFAVATTLRWVAFRTPSDGAGLFQTERYPVSGNGPVECVLYTRATADGGASFGPAGQPLARTNCGNGVAYSAVAFAGPHDLLAYGPNLAVSHDMGRSWQRERLPGPLAGMTTHGASAWAIVADRCRAVAQLCGLELLRSQNGGVSWQLLRPQPPDRTTPSAPVFDAEMATSTLLARTPDGTLLLALPGSLPGIGKPAPATGTVQRLVPGHRHWTHVAAPCDSGLYQSELAVASDGVAWLACAGEPGVGLQIKSLALSSDGGARWTVAVAACGLYLRHCHVQMPLGGYLGGLAAVSSHTVFYVGDRGSLAGTFDGGRNWRVWPQIGNDAAGSLQVTFINAHDGWAIAQGLGPSTSLWRTRDAGRTWSRA